MVKDIKLILISSLSIIFIYISYSLLPDVLYRNSAVYRQFYNDIKRENLNLSYSLLPDVLYRNSAVYRQLSDDLKIENLLNKIEKTTDINQKGQMIVSLISCANNSNSSYYSLDRLEKLLVEIANEFSIPLNDNIQENSVLHIASATYSVGGHSRVIERWIENSPDDEIHSFLLTKNGGITSRLINSVYEKHGNILTLDYEKTIIEQALELRQIASEYEKIVLHVHPDDFLPILAFGHKDFKRPVFFFNHADHRFWLGLSIADCVVDFRKYGSDILKKYRGEANNKIIPLPIDFDKKNYFDKEESRKELGFPLDKTIIFSSGNKNKFIPTKKLDYAKFMEKLYAKYPDVLFILVGPEQDFSPRLKNIPSENYRIFASMDNHLYMKYLATADIVIDSFPIPGGTTVIDTIISQKPVLSLKTAFSQNDFIIESSAYKPSIDELVTACLELIKDESKRAVLLKELTERLNEKHSLNAWRKGIKELYETYTTHSIHNFTSVKKKYW